MECTEGLCSEDATSAKHTVVHPPKELEAWNIGSLPGIRL